MAKYQGKPWLVEKKLKRQFKPEDFVFVCDMCDLFGDWVSNDIISEIFYTIAVMPKTQFLFLTKNPKRYYFLGEALSSKHCVLGCTIESNGDYLFSFAPKQSERIAWMLKLSTDYAATEHLPRFISIEPILDFDLEEFSKKIIEIRPWAVAVGYDNYGKNLPEPTFEKTLTFINTLEHNGIKVYRKTLRKAWNEK